MGLLYCIQGCKKLPPPLPLGEYNQAVGEENQVAEKGKGMERKGKRRE